MSCLRKATLAKMYSDLAQQMMMKGMDGDESLRSTLLADWATAGVVSALIAVSG